MIWKCEKKGYSVRLPSGTVVRFNNGFAIVEDKKTNDEMKTYPHSFWCKVVDEVGDTSIKMVTIASTSSVNPTEAPSPVVESKPISLMNLVELRNVCNARGIKYSDTDTKQNLRNKLGGDQ